MNSTTVPNGDWATAIQDLNGGMGIDLTVDYVGASYFQQCLDCAAIDGRIIQLGALSGTNLEGKGRDGRGVDIGAFVSKRIRFQGSTLRSRDPEYQGKLRDLFVEKVLPGLIGKGQNVFQSHVDQVMSWHDIGKAHEALERNQTMGKIVCRVD